MKFCRSCTSRTFCIDCIFVNIRTMMVSICIRVECNRLAASGQKISKHPTNCIEAPVNMPHL